MKLFTIVSFLSTLSHSVIVHKDPLLEELKPGDIPTIIYGQTGATCEDDQYTELVTKMKSGLRTHVECFATQVMESIHGQAVAACKAIQENSSFNNEEQINLVGVGAGGLIARYILEECDIAGENPQQLVKVRNLLTIGTPNMGFADIPSAGCQGPAFQEGMGPICAFEKTMRANLAFAPAVQAAVSCAGYYRHQDNLDEYHARSTFLASLNNEVGLGTDNYEKHRNRIEGLHTAMFVMFSQDEIVFPVQSAIFGQFAPKGEQGKGPLLGMEDTRWYDDNDLGLKYLNARHKIDIIEIDGKHAQYTENDIMQIFVPFLEG